MMLYVVIYTDGSWRGAGDRILGIFDNEPQAEALVAHVEELKDFEKLSGSDVRIDTIPMNVACHDSVIDDLR